MKKLGIVFLSAVVLSACSVKADSIAEKKETETEWQYRDEDTTMATKKNEVVHVQTDASGNPTKITVDTKLSGMNQENVIKQQTDLKNITNKNGDEQFEQKKGFLYFENLGKEISYSGTSEKELPVRETIQYYLDGKEIDGKNLAGKTGHVSMRLTYQNTMQYQNVHVPFTCISFLMLPADHFENVSVENGEIYEVDDNAMVMGLSFPSLKEDLDLESYEDLDMNLSDFVEIEADVKDFTLDFTETIITNGLFSDMKDDDLSNLTSLSERFQKLGKIGNTLAESGTKLTDAYTLIQNGVLSYLSGIEGLQKGVEQVKDGTGSLHDNMEQLVSGAQAVSNSLNAVDLSLLDSADIERLKNNIALISTGTTQLSALYESIQTLQEEVNSVVSDEEEKQKINDSFSSVLVSLQETGNSLQQAVTDTVETMDKLPVETLDSLQQQLTLLQKTSEAVSSGLASFNQGMEGVDQGMDQILQGVNRAVSNHAQLEDALSAYASGVHQYQNGIVSLNEDGLQKLEEKGGEEFGKLISSIKELKEADISYQGFMTCEDGQEGSVTFMLESEKIAK